MQCGGRVLRPSPIRQGLFCERDRLQLLLVLDFHPRTASRLLLGALSWWLLRSCRCFPLAQRDFALRYIFLARLFLRIFLVFVSILVFRL